LRNVWSQIDLDCSELNYNSKMEFFKYCTFDNIAFKIGLIFIVIFVVTFGFVCYYWKQEAEEERVEARMKAMENVTKELPKLEMKKETPSKH
jgi:hypothetical protein